MAGFPMIAVEWNTTAGMLYLSTHAYTTRSTDTPASIAFDVRIVDDLTFKREVGTVFWGEKPRGRQNIGALELVAADGQFDSLVGTSQRDRQVVVKRGESEDAYATFTTVGTFLVEQLDFQDERILRITLKDTSARLERALQLSLYPTTTPNISLRGRPRPITIGKAYQVPLQQPDMTGNGRYDVHDNEQWLGVDQAMDQGSMLIEGTAYQRANTSGIYGIERLTAIGGKQVASVCGAFNIAATPITDDFTSLAGWTVNNGGVAGRDATIVSNELRLLNTLGGADLFLISNTTATVSGTAATEFYWFEFDCTQWTSGSAQLRQTATAAPEVTVNRVGRYTGVMRAQASFTPRWYAVNGSNCDLRIDNFRIRRITLIERLPDVLTYLCVTKGPLSAGDLDTAGSIAALDAAAPYALGFYASEPVMIADALDSVMASYGGWWYINRLNKLVVGQLTAPTGTATWSFNETNIAPGIRVELDTGKGLSNVILAKRNWAPYGESELVAALNSVSLNSADKGASVTLSNSNYTYSASAAGSVRQAPQVFGERYYFEVQATAIDGTQQHYLGIANGSASVASYPGAAANCVAYRANGQSWTSAAGTAYGTAWAANDYIGIAVDMRAAANGSRRAHVRIYYRRNGTWQASSNPDTEAGYLAAALGATGFAYLMAGANVASTNAGTVNFGQAAFVYAPPDDYLAPAWHRQTILAEYRYRYESTVALAGAYAHADSSGPDGEAGIPTLLSREANARTECDRWATLYSVERFWVTFDALLDSGVSADQIEPGDLIEITYPRYGFSAKKLRVAGVEGSMLSRTVKITAWG